MCGANINTDLSKLGKSPIIFQPKILKIIPENVFIIFSLICNIHTRNDD